MKKIISVLLAVLMICSCMAVSAFAVEKGEKVPVGENIFGIEYKYALPGACDCMDRHKEPKCDCCLFCPNLDVSLQRSCVEWFTNPDGERYAAVCCVNCTGLIDCNCGCGCEVCATDNKDLGDYDNTIGDYWGPEEQKSFIDNFQAILKRISDAFDAFFNAIFEFLRIDGVVGKE